MTSEQKMKRRVYRYVMVYLALMLVLAAWGAQNQRFHDYHAELIGIKHDLLLQRADLNSIGVSITGAPAVRSWALAQGMVPAPEGQEGLAIVAQAAPVQGTRQTGLEVFTLWR